MQNQMEMGNVTVMTRRDRMMRSHSHMPRCGDFIPIGRKIKYCKSPLLIYGKSTLLEEKSELKIVEPAQSCWEQ